ncbi:MAG: ABC transporter substrate-binding protein [Acidimicrobiia bacterium]
MNRLWRSRNVALMVMFMALALVAAACSSSDGGSGDTAESGSRDTAESPTTTEVDTTTTSSVALDTTTTTEAKTQKPYGGVAIVADDQEPPTLNTFIPGGDSLIVGRIGQTYLSGVWEIDGFTLTLIPEMVTELPNVGNGGVTVNDDGTMTVRYQILEGAMWSDGVPVTGADFQFTLDTILDPDLPITRTTYEDIISSEVGDKTFEYTLNAPTAQYELIFGTIIPKHAVEGTDFVADWNDTMWPSAGPFVFDEWSTGEFLSVVRNDNYWKSDPDTGQALPYLDKVTFKFIPETESIITAFKAREIDVIQPPPATDTIEALQALESEGARVEVLSGPIWEHLNFQFGPGRLERNPNSCNDNYSMRLAIAQTIDKTVLTDEILAGQVEPLESYVTPYSPALSSDAWAQYSLDNAAAAENYAKAVEATGVECSVVFSTTSNNDARAKMAELFVGMFEASGIPYENDLEDSQLFFGETLDNGMWDLGEWAWQGSPGLSGLVAVHDLFDPEAPPPEGSNYYRWGTDDSSVIDEATQRFAEIRDAVNATVDETELAGLFAEGEQIIADNLVIFPLYARLSTAAVWADELGGFKHNPTQASDTWNIESWYRTDLAG